jgi:hypothetical protein
MPEKAIGALAFIGAGGLVYSLAGI